MVLERRTSPIMKDETSPWATEIRGLKPYLNPPVPNPAPLGLIGFALTTALLQMKHTRIAGDSAEEMDGVDTVTMGFAMFFGGLVQLIAGISEIRRNNLFGYTAFCLYGGFWMSFGTIEIVTLLATESPATNKKATQSMLFMLSLISIMMWSLTFKINKTICSLFFLLSTTCMLLSFGTRNETVDIIGGYFGLVTAANAFWLAFAELVNDVYGEGGNEIIPLGHWKSNAHPTSGGVHVPGRIMASSPSIYMQGRALSEALQQMQKEEQINSDLGTVEENAEEESPGDKV